VRTFERVASKSSRRTFGCKREGALCDRAPKPLPPLHQWIAERTNFQKQTSALSDVIRGADVFIGVSAPDVLTEEDVKRLAPNAIVFALANPDPEISSELAAPHCKVIATGRSDFPNQINNVLCFPGLFRGVLEVRASRITETMKVAAARAITAVISENELSADYIIPSVFDRRVAEAVAAAVSQAAVEANVARRRPKPAHLGSA
jgi:malate dehydrogenase (oxaloacetate-decarboxylating)